MPLTHAEDGNSNLPEEAYGYDANGNRIFSNGETYITGKYNRLENDGTYTYVYDNEGNITRRNLIGSDIYTEYVWDHRNRLITVNYSDENEEVHPYSYTYDAFNKLIGKSDAIDDTVSQTLYVYDNGQVVLQFDQENNVSEFRVLYPDDLSHRYLWGPAVDQLLADEHVDDIYDAENNETLWALTDRQGSITDMVDDTGTLRLHRLFDAYGNIADETHYNSAGSPVTSGAGYLDEAFAYTGRLLDKDTGLQNNLNRWYDGSTGRWMSEDPIQDDVNSYRYVNNSPVNGSDPSGLAGMWWGPMPITYPGALPGTQPTTPPKNQQCERPFDWHWDRNRFNDASRTEKEAIRRRWIKLPDDLAIYHRFNHGFGNSKYVAPDGHGEAAYFPNGEIDTCSENVGTYNYYPPDDWRGHAVADVLPYYIWGNAPDDTTPWWRRIIGAPSTSSGGGFGGGSSGGGGASGGW